MGRRFVMPCALAFGGAALLALGYWALRAYVAQLVYDGQYERQVVGQACRSRQLNGQTVFLGDSLTAGLATSGLTASSENFGIHGDTVDRLATRLSRYDFSRSKTIVVQIGINDWRSDHLTNFDQEYRRLVARFPKHIRLISVSLTPSNPARALDHSTDYIAAMQRTNRVIEHLCIKRTNCTYLDLATSLSDSHGLLRPAYDSGDGLHLSVAGYTVWRTLYRALITPPSSPPPPSRAAATDP